MSEVRGDPWSRLWDRLETRRIALRNDILSGRCNAQTYAELCGRYNEAAQTLALMDEIAHGRDLIKADPPEPINDGLL